MQFSRKRRQIAIPQSALHFKNYTLFYVLGFVKKKKKKETATEESHSRTPVLALSFVYLLSLSQFHSTSVKASASRSTSLQDAGFFLSFHVLQVCTKIASGVELSACRVCKQNIKIRTRRLGHPVSSPLRAREDQEEEEQQEEQEQEEEEKSMSLFLSLPPKNESRFVNVGKRFPVPFSLSLSLSEITEKTVYTLSLRTEICRHWKCTPTLRLNI